MDPNLIHKLKDLMDEAQREGGKVEIDFTAPGRVDIRCFGAMQRGVSQGYRLPGKSETVFQLRREVQHAL